MHIVAFAASSSRQSINKQLVTHAAQIAGDEIVPSAEIEILDLNDYEMPLYSIDREKEGGIPDQARQFRAKIDTADALIISFAEHNASYSAAYKSLYDWASRLEGKVYEGKPVVLLSTSPGGRGGATVMAQIRQSLPHYGGRELSHLSVPKFYDVFDSEAGTLKDAETAEDLRMALQPLAAC